MAVQAPQRSSSSTLTQKNEHFYSLRDHCVSPDERRRLFRTFLSEKNLEVQKMVTREDLVSAWRAMPLISGTRSNWVRSPNFFLSPNNLKAHKTSKKVAQLLAQARKVIIRDQHLFRSN